MLFWGAKKELSSNSGYFILTGIYCQESPKYVEKDLEASNLLLTCLPRHPQWNFEWIFEGVWFESQEPGYDVVIVGGILLIMPLI